MKRLIIVALLVTSCGGQRCRPVACDCGAGWQTLTNCGVNLTTTIGHNRRHYRFYDCSANVWRAGNVDAECKVEYL